MLLTCMIESYKTSESFLTCFNEGRSSQEQEKVKQRRGEMRARRDDPPSVVYGHALPEHLDIQPF